MCTGYNLIAFIGKDVLLSYQELRQHDFAILTVWKMTDSETHGNLLLQNCRLYHSPDNEMVDILIRHGKIAQINKSGRLSKQADVINAGGRIVAPGFIKQNTTRYQ